MGGCRKAVVFLAERPQPAPSRVSAPQAEDRGVRLQRVHRVGQGRIFRFSESHGVREVWKGHEPSAVIILLERRRVPQHKHLFVLQAELPLDRPNQRRLFVRRISAPFAHLWVRETFGRAPGGVGRPAPNRGFGIAAPGCTRTKHSTRLPSQYGSSRRLDLVGPADRASNVGRRAGAPGPRRRSRASTRANASSVSRLSVSVGSIIRASGTISGK